MPRRRLIRPPRLALALAIAATGFAGATASALAAPDLTKCSLANGVLTVDMHGHTTIDYASSVIVVHSGRPKACTGGLPTTLNTDAVRIIDHSDNPNTPAPLDGDTTLTIQQPGQYAPGRTAESNSASEVEFVVNMNGGDHDELIAVTGPNHTAYWAAGTGGINWNSDNDPDLYGAFDHVEFSGSRYDDRFSARGGFGTGNPLVAPTLRIFGGEGDDELLGSDGRDDLEAGAGNDVVGGFGGDDAVEDGPGDDSMAGGGGVDTVSFDGSKRGIVIDLSTFTPVEAEGLNTAADFENVRGTSYADTLIGNDAPNRLSGYRGDDTLIGRGGADQLLGGEDADTVSYADSTGAINADLGAKRVTQGTTIDALQDVEHLVGSPFADTMMGDAAANRLVGGGGADTISGTNGADRLEVRDGAPDAFVSCGDDSAPDVVIADRVGVDPVNADCETTEFAPEPPVQQPQGEPTPEPRAGGGAGGEGGAGGDGSQGQTPDRGLAFTLGGATTQRALKQGVVRVQVACPQESCSAVVSATAKLPRRGATRAARIDVRGVRTALSQGVATTVRLKLTRPQLRTLRRALAGGQRPALAVRAEAVDDAGNRVERALRVRIAK